MRHSQAFIEECKRGPAIESELRHAGEERHGDGTQACAHPLTGSHVPVWVGKLRAHELWRWASWGSAHDERDFEFAKKYGLSIEPVIQVDGRNLFHRGVAELVQRAWPLRQFGQVRWPRIRGSGGCGGRGFERLELGEKRITWRLRDWGISRQRYWGFPSPSFIAPIAAWCRSRRSIAVILPDNLVPDGSGNPLLKDAAFLACTCPRCGRPARRETDTMDTFVDSSWYFLRFACSDNGPRGTRRACRLLAPVDQYSAGSSTRSCIFCIRASGTRVMRELGAVSFKEPFTHLFTQGMVPQH